VRPEPTAPGDPVDDNRFGAFYYAHSCGRPYRRDAEWMAFFGGIADRIVEGIAPQRVLDAGCAFGLLVEALRTRGVDASGVDLSAYAIGRVDERVRAFCRRASITEEFQERYDLIVCIEVLEHMPSADAEAAISNMCRHSDDILVSSTPSDHGEPTHINVHPPEHWAELFARHDFHRDTEYDATFITEWAVRFRRRREPVYRVIRGYERLYVDQAVAARDARAYATGVQETMALVEGRVSKLLEEADGLRLHVAGLQNELKNREHLTAVHHREVDYLTQRAEDAETATQEVQHRLIVALDRVFHMERSYFWRMRAPWIALKRLLGSRNDS
jgi:SAM-dependent methyltransferase